MRREIPTHLKNSHGHFHWGFAVSYCGLGSVLREKLSQKPTDYGTLPVALSPLRPAGLAGLKRS